jgi:hypothetical protein
MTDGEDTSIRVSLDTWRRLQARKTRPGMSFDEVIQDLLDHADGGTGGTVKEAEDVSTDAARHANPTDEATPSPPSPVRDRVNVLDRVAESWDNDGRHEDRRAAADAALSFLLSRGQLSKSEALDELLPEYSVERQSPETWWRKNVRPVLQEAATYSKGVNAYVLDEPSQQ